VRQKAEKKKKEKETKEPKMGRKSDRNRDCTQVRGSGKSWGRAQCQSMDIERIF
jgi:hypothetical protein